MCVRKQAEAKDPRGIEPFISTKLVPLLLFQNPNLTGTAPLIVLCPHAHAELGAGVGHTSLCLARNLPSFGCICATDMATDGAVEWLQHNIQLNHALLGPAAASRLVVLPCDWRDYDSSTSSSSHGVAHQGCTASGGAVGEPTGAR